MPRLTKPKPERFIPHIVLECEFTRPKSYIWAVAILGPSNLLTRRLDTAYPSQTFLRQALMIIPKTVPYFGAVKSFVIC